MVLHCPPEPPKAAQVVYFDSGCPVPTWLEKVTERRPGQAYAFTFSVRASVQNNRGQYTIRPMQHVGVRGVMFFDANPSGNFIISGQGRDGVRFLAAGIQGSAQP